MKECGFCDFPENTEGVWEIIIYRKYRGAYGKRFKNICHQCLAEALEGYHTGGGLVGNVIKKIKRIGK